MKPLWLLLALVACFSSCCTSPSIAQGPEFKVIHVVQVPLCENGRCDAVTVVPPVVVVKQATQPGAKQPVPLPPPSKTVKQVSGPQWTNHDGLSARDHIHHVHGTNTTGMTNAEVLQSRNDYHNKYGAGHPVKESQSSSNCPGGVCPQQQSYSNPIPRLRILGRWR